MSDVQDQSAVAVATPLEGSPNPPGNWEDYVRRLVKSEIRKALPRATDKLVRDEETAGLIHLLAARSNDAKDEVLRKALTLYGLALDANEKGNKLVIVGPDDEIIHDVIGFESMTES